MNSNYTTITDYIESKTTLASKIQAYDAIISGLETTMLTAIESGHIKQYEFDDGLMKVRTEYRSVNDIANAMTGYERLRQMYINRYNGRVRVLRGGNL
jgi:hypothetical protein